MFFYKQNYYKSITDFRKYMHNSYPTVLDYYYRLTEKLGAPTNTRSIDLAYWEQEK